MNSASARMYWVDNLRTFLILLVVNIHACVTYSHVGSWYYMVDPDPAMPVKLVFAVWQGHLQSFFMGLLFFLAGYFADRSLTRRGTRSFLAERWRRLGIPTLIFMLLIHPFVLLALNPWHATFAPFLTWYRTYLASWKFLGSSGPLWFAFALLIFSAVLAGVRGGKRAAPLPDRSAAPQSIRLTAAKILLSGAGLATASFLVRTVQPIGTNILNFQLCFFPQYIFAFVFGLVVSRRDGLQAIARSPVALRAGKIALVAGPIALIAISIAGGPVSEHGVNQYFGGWHWQSLALALWEQVTGVCLALGAMAWFARNLDREGPVLKWLSDRSFAVYVVHTPVLVAITMQIARFGGNIFVMAGILTVLALVGSYVAADLVRRIPGAREVL